MLRACKHAREHAPHALPQLRVLGSYRSRSRSSGCFKKDFSQPDAYSAESLARANEVLQSSRLFRYQGQPKHPTGEDSTAGSQLKHDTEDVHMEAAAFEREFARAVGAKYAAGLNSCGSAMMLALKAARILPQ